jgi:hypothetical protein
LPGQQGRSGTPHNPPSAGLAPSGTTSGRGNAVGAAAVAASQGGTTSVRSRPQAAGKITVTASTRIESRSITADLLARAHPEHKAHFAIANHARFGSALYRTIAMREGSNGSASL